MLNMSLGTTMGVAALGATQESTVAKSSERQQDKAEESGMPYGTIGDLRISRLILGSNMPGAHSRDLLYVRELARAYNTKERMLDTFELAESQGINTILQGNPRLIQEYNAKRGGNLRQIRPFRTSERARQRANSEVPCQSHGRKCGGWLCDG